MSGIEVGQVWEHIGGRTDDSDYVIPPSGLRLKVEEIDERKSRALCDLTYPRQRRPCKEWRLIPFGDKYRLVT